MTLQRQGQNTDVSYAFSLDDLAKQLGIFVNYSDEAHWQHAFFRMPRVRDLFQTLDNFVHYDDGIILISGAKGIGKTSLLKACAKAWQNDPLLLCSLKLSQAIAAKIKASSPEDDISMIVKTWNWGTFSIEKKRLIFLLDDIDLFTLDDFVRLETLLHSSFPHVDKIMAVTFANFGTMNDDLQKLVHAHHLKSITFNTYTLIDVEILLFNVLRRFGVPSATYVFSHDVLEWLCTEAQGFPGKVIKLAHALLQLGAHKGFEFIDWSIVEYYKNRQNVHPKTKKPTLQIQRNLEIKQLYAVDTTIQAHGISNLINSKNGQDKKNAHAILVKEALQEPAGAATEDTKENSKPDHDSLSQKEIDRMLGDFLAGDTLQDTTPNEESKTTPQEVEDKPDELTQELLDKLIHEHETRNRSKKQKDLTQKRYVVKTRKGNWKQSPTLKKKSLFSKKPKNICYMDIGTNAIKLLLTSPEGEIKHSKIFSISKETAENIVSGKLTKDTEEQIIASLNSTSQNYLKEGDDLVISLSGKYHVSLNLSFPNMPVKELENAIKFEIEGKHHLFSNQEKITRFKIQEPQAKISDRISVYCAVIQKNVVDRIVALTQNLGFNVRMVTVNSLAIHNYLLQTGVLHSINTTVIVDIGTHISELLIVQGSQIMLTQTINVGGFTFNQSLSDALMVDYGLAEEFKIKLGSAMMPQEKKVIDTTDNIEVYEALSPVLEQMDGEIGRAIEAYRLHHPDALIGEIILTGGGSRLSHLDARFSSTFSLPVIRLEAPQGLAKTDEQDPFETLEFLPALGLMTGFSESDGILDFLEKSNPLPGKKKKSAAKKRAPLNYDHSNKNKWQSRVLYAVFALFLGFVLFNFYVEKLESKSLTFENLLNENSIKMTELDNLIKQNRALKEQIQMIEKLKQNRIRYSETLSEIFKLRPQNINVSSISMLDGRLVIEGAAKSSDFFPNFLKSLGHLPDFNQPELRSVNKNNGPGIHYQIVCKPKRIDNK